MFEPYNQNAAPQQQPRVSPNFWPVLQLIGGVVALCSIVFFYVLYLPVIACIFLGISAAIILVGCIGDHVTQYRARKGTQAKPQNGEKKKF